MYNQEIDKLENQKRLLWQKRNSLKNNEDMVCRLCKQLKIDRYNITINCSGELDLIVEHNLDSYKVQNDRDQLTLNLLERNKALNKKDKEKYHLIMTFEGDDIWYSILKYIKNRGKFCGENNSGNRAIQYI